MPSVLERSWVGRRVTVRRRIDPHDGSAEAFSDVVGDLVALDAERAVVDTRHGPVEVALGGIAVAKLAPPSTRDELDVLAVASRGWRAAEDEALGGWTLRADPAGTRRATSVLPLGQPPVPLAEALATVTDWYRARALPPRVQVPTEARRLLDAELGERGWAPSEDTHVMAARLDALPDDPRIGAATVTAAPSNAWLAVHGDASPAMRALLSRHDRVGFAAVELDGEVVGIGRGTLDDGWLGVTCVQVRPDARRQGTGRAVMAALWGWARQAGAQRSCLQVASGNRVAVEWYERLGYWVHHDYRYRTAPDS